MLGNRSASLVARPIYPVLVLGLLLGALLGSPSCAEEVAGDVDPGYEPARPLTDRGLQNLEAFTRLLGYVRFFHPSDGVAEADWDSLALAGVQRAEAAEGPTGLARALEELFRPIAPSVRVFVTGAPPPVAPEVLEPPAEGAGRVIAWYHVGVGLLNRAGRSIYSSVRKVFEDGREVEAVAESEDATGEHAWEGPAPVPAERVLRADLGGGVSALVPMALHVREGVTLPRPPAGARPPLPSKPEVFEPAGDDRTTRLAGVALAWPIFQHFYPYFDVVEVDWGAQLARALRSAAEDADGEAYLATLNHLVASLQDGHGSAFHPELTSFARLPLEWRWLEERLVIVGLGEGAPEELAVGDVVVAVDGVAAAEALATWEEQVSASNPASRRQLAALWMLAEGEEEAVLSVATPGGERREVTVPRSRTGDERIPLEPRPEPAAELAPGVRYLDLTRVSEEEQTAALGELAEAQAVIFDLRGYPMVSTAAIARLVDEPVTSPQWHIPVVTRPDREGMTFTFLNWEVQPAEPRIRGKVAFLTDERAISYAETYLGIVEHYELGEIVGSPTAGTNGNVNAFKLPGGFGVSWTGMKVLKHDGSRHHGVGILPTVPVTRTIAGIRQGRDEVLERAIEVVTPDE